MCINMLCQDITVPKMFLNEDGITEIRHVDTGINYQIVIINTTHKGEYINQIQYIGAYPMQDTYERIVKEYDEKQLY